MYKHILQGRAVTFSDWKDAPLKPFNFTRNSSSYLQCIYETMKPTLQMELSSEVKDSSQILKAVAGVS